ADAGGRRLRGAGGDAGARQRAGGDDAGGQAPASPGGRRRRAIVVRAVAVDAARGVGPRSSARDGHPTRAGTVVRGASGPHVTGLVMVAMGGLEPPTPAL